MSTAIRFDVHTFRACVDELIGTDQLLERVAQLLHHDQTPGLQDTALAKRPTRPAPPAPWNDHAAAVLLDIHAGARDVEANLTRLAFSRTLTRSGSDIHTRRALRNIPDLIAHCGALFPDHWVVASSTKQLLAWPRSCRLLLDEARWGEEPWTKAPGGLRCPHCQRRLLLAPGWDKEQQPPVWCIGCPVELEGDERAFPRRQWPADTWLGRLNETSA